MRVLHVIPSFYPAHVYGGPVQSVYRLSCELARAGHAVRVLTTDANGPDRVLEVATDREVEIAGGLRVRYCRRRARQSVSPALLRLLPSYVRWADVVHLTAVYSFPTLPTLLACRAMGKPVVWSPRGALQRWKGSTRVRSKVVWEWVCAVASPRRLVLHVTSAEEARESAGRVGRAEAVLVANGVDVPDRVAHVEAREGLRLLCLGRVHPKKGLENLLTACKILDGRIEGRWSLVIAGADAGEYTEQVRALIDELALSPRVEVLGFVVGEAKQRLFERSDVAVLPSYTESFALVAAEALAHGVPVAASKGTPWSRIEEVGCGLWVDNDPESLAKALERMHGMPLRDMGERGRAWIAREFSWTRRAQEMAAVYEDLARAGRRRGAVKGSTGHGDTGRT
jgi:glycosyltransferase involved in cell wall biosynthesis